MKQVSRSAIDNCNEIIHTQRSFNEKKDTKKIDFISFAFHLTFFRGFCHRTMGPAHVTSLSFIQSGVGSR